MPKGYFDLEGISTNFVVIIDSLKLISSMKKSENSFYYENSLIYNICKNVNIKSCDRLIFKLLDAIIKYITDCQLNLESLKKIRLSQINQSSKKGRQTTKDQLDGIIYAVKVIEYLEEFKKSILSGIDKDTNFERFPSVAAFELIFSIIVRAQDIVTYYSQSDIGITPTMVEMLKQDIEKYNKTNGNSEKQL